MQLAKSERSGTEIVQNSSENSKVQENTGIGNLDGQESLTLVHFFG
jgi:hypothetical protein